MGAGPRMRPRNPLAHLLPWMDRSRSVDWKDHEHDRVLRKPEGGVAQSHR